MNNVSEVVKSDLCVGCGVCMDVCPKNCIQINHGVVNNPTVWEQDCVACGKCLKACPGKGVEIEKLSESFFAGEGIVKDSHIGYYHKCFSGYSNEYAIRYHCASGGSVSQFLIYLLERELIDGAVVVGFQKDAPMKPRVYIARRKEEVLDAKSSKYCVVAYDGIIAEIEKSEGRYVMVGLPCHIQGFRKAEKLSKKLSERMIGYFAIYCSAGKNMQSQDFFIWRYGVDKDKIARFAYRDYGCMGDMVFEDKQGKEIVNKIPLLSYYMSAKGFFTPWRCMLCIDHFGELADVCFGDIQIGEYRKDKTGVNSIVSRSAYWTRLLLEAKDAGCLHLDDIDAETVISSQGFCKHQKKGPGVVAEYNIRRMLGKALPEYDQPLLAQKAYAKDYIKSVMRIMMRYIGRRPSMWWIIKFLDKDKSR